MNNLFKKSKKNIKVKIYGDISKSAMGFRKLPAIVIALCPSCNKREANMEYKDRLCNPCYYWKEMGALIKDDLENDNVEDVMSGLKFISDIKCTTLDQDERKRLYAVFMEIEVNKEGRVKKKDFLEKCRDYEITHLAEKLLNQFDYQRMYV